MKTITLNLFEFAELSDSAKETAREWYRRCSEGDNYWSEYIIDEAVEQGKLLGIDFKMRDVQLHGGGTRQKPCIWWSGFGSQGDGACFEGTWRARDVKAGKVAEGWGTDPATTEIKRIAKEFQKIAQAFPSASFSVTHHSRYSHERSVDYTFTDGDNEEREWSTEFEQVLPDMTEASRDFMRWIYRTLEKAYEYEQSNECVDENIKANEYTFTEDGNRYE